jgi:hypothetical protein
MNLMDLVVAIVAAVAIFLPPREMYALDAAKGTPTERAALALAEARARAHPSDGAQAAELARLLTATGHKDWAVEAAAEASASASRETRWRALLATSVAYAERLEAGDALLWAKRALEACHAAAAACPTEEEVRMDIYVRHLDAGVRSGINPRRDPEGFRAASQGEIRSIYLKGGTPPSPPPAGSGAGGAAGAGATPPAAPPPGPGSASP